MAFSLQVEANFLTSIFTKNASANSVSMDPNSQNISLLESNVSVSFLNNDQNEDLNKLSQNDTFLLPEVSSMGVWGAGVDTFNSEISVYVVRPGDSISKIAQMFNVSTNTVLWANNKKKNDKISEGEILLILPVNGVKHVVQKGETLKGIAKKYNVELSYVAGFNGLDEDVKLKPGEELIIPDAEMTEERENVDNKNNSKTSTSSVKTSVASSKNLSGYYINPVPGAVRTQGLHGRNAVDLAAPIGTPIYAAAGGKVSLARYGWNGAYGNMVIIEHSNGTKTLYSHLSSISTTSGATVKQGEIIGKVGNTGRVRAAPGGNGAHLHFEVHGARNPGVDNSWAR